jgi:hypothetical protein
MRAASLLRRKHNEQNRSARERAKDSVFGLKQSFPATHQNEDEKERKRRFRDGGDFRDK